MPYGLYISAAGAAAQSKRLEVLSNNLANADTTGFKRQMAVLQSRHTEAIEQGDDYYGSRSINDVGGGVFVRETVTDFADGVLKKTGIPTDAAIAGDGFFVVSKDDQPMLTRAGNFVVNGGRLVNPDGLPVLDVGGNPIELNPAIGPIKITGEGDVLQNDVAAGAFIPIGRLALVDVDSPQQLDHVGQNLFRADGETRPLVGNERNVKGGYLERSTTRPAIEMMELIEASRAFESNVKMIQNQDQMLGQLINRVLKANS